MKESTLLEMKNKIESLTNIIQYLLTEYEHIKTLSVGTMKTIKHMPGYDDALGILKKEIKQDVKDGVIKQDTK
tara:strand:+ start:659 stop:877 length:219 start_codon:yes stop_codon:yes gene_type:complete